MGVDNNARLTPKGREAMVRRFGFDASSSDVRARTTYLVQIGYNTQGRQAGVRGDCQKVETECLRSQ